MAEETLGNLIVRVGLDGANFDKGLKNINSRIELARSELRAAASSFDNFGKTVDSLRVKQDYLAKMYQLSGERVKALKKQYDELVKAHGAESDAALKAGKSLNQAISQYNRLGRELDNVSRELANQQSVWLKAEHTISSFADRMKTTGDKMMGIGHTMSLSVTAPLAGVATAAVRTGMAFDQEMSKVKAISGATSEELKALREQAIKLGADSTKSSTEVAAGMLEMSKAGFTVNQIMKAMPGVIAASEASGEDMARTTEVMTAALNGFGLEASKASHVADVLAEVANRTNADINDMGYAFKYAAPVARTLGLSLEDVAAAAGIMSNAGIKGEQAGTTLRMSMLRLADPPKEAANTIEQLGLKIEDSNGKMLPLRDIIAQLNEKTKDMSKTQKAAAISAIFGTEAMSGMVAAVDAGPEAFDKLKTALIESDGAAQKAAKEMKDNFAGAVEELKGTLESIGIQISDVMTPVLKDLTQWLTKAGDKFQNLSPEAKRLIVILGLVAAGIGPVTIALAAFVKSIGILSGGIAKGIAWLGKYRAEASLTSKSLTALGTTATVTSTKINTASATVGKAGKGMTALQGGAVAAGGALTMLGGTWGSVAGIATMFLPQIFSAGKGVLSFGKNALTSAGGVGGLATKVFGAVKNFGSLSRILGVARIGLGALGGPIGLTITGVTLLAQGGYKLYKHLKEESIPALDSFGNKVSDSTTKAVLGYKKLNDEATAQLNQLYWSGTTVSQETANQITSTFQQMGNQISTSLQNNFNKSYQSLSTFLANSKNISAAEQQEILNNVKNKHVEQQQTVQNAQNRIKQILETARQEKRALTQAEKNEINNIQNQMMTTAVQTMSKSEQEQKVILERLRQESYNITARQAAETVRNSLKAKNGAVKEANDKYNKTVAAIIRERDVTGSISKEQADKLIKEAKRQRDEAVAKAKDMHENVVNQAKLQAGGQAKHIDWATGQVLTKWDEMVRGAAIGVNGILKGINFVLEKMGMKTLPYWYPKGLNKPKKSKAMPRSIGGRAVSAYAKGTSSSGHPGGPAIVGEKGRELAHIPGVGVTLVGTKGPELIPNLPKGTSVLPNKYTERLLKSYGFPGYEKGVGDFFDWALKGPKSLMKKVWKIFDPKIPNLGGVLTGMGKGIISFLKNKSLSFIKKKIDEFFTFDIGGVGKGSVRKWIATAVKITGVPSSWINPLVTIAMRESGGNPRAINLWDINAKRGIASRGLMQTIPPTFNAYKLPGLNDIWNPVHNAVAAIRYILKRYKTVWNVPGIRNLMKGRGYVGYKDGTNYHPGGLAWVGEEGEELGYIPGKGLALLGLGGPMLLDLPRGTSVLPHKETKQLLRSFWIPGYADGIGKFPQIEGTGNFSKLVNSITDGIRELLQSLQVQDRTIHIEVPVILDGREIARGNHRYVTEFQQKEQLRALRFEGR
ncbi:phage tail tape measure protein [Bacillus methanolicus]|uniref:phage tail tape measure protein n=1 Tax=Bacillus methanolicus TaxID=1471 RepID=UPI00200ED9CE|nr:phage tail tape measure protein [Bacillus methanolicus]UQD53301.1 phage tail tape measure protein [Bacillus methanolicus]